MLVGRETERGALARLVAHARAGRSGVLGIVGEAGIGKTALLEELIAATSGMQVLSARGVESEADVPFAALAELLRPALTSLHRIPAPQADALAGSLALAPSVAHDRFAVGAATLSLLAGHAEQRPLLVVVDDAHLLDGPSAAALLFAARRVVADPIAMVFAAREGEPSLLDASDLPVLRLAGLTPADAAQLLPDVRDEDLLRLHTATGGNPLALLELPAEGAKPPPFDQPVPLPARLAAAFQRRSAGLPMPTQRMLLLLAASDVGTVSLLARAAAQLGTTVESLEPAEAAGLIRIGDGGAEFRHPLVRSAIYREASPGDRRAAHAALAAALPDRDVDRRAWHLAAATIGPDAHVSSALEQAARRAAQRSAYGVASRGLERAARFSPDPGVACGLLIDAARSASSDGDSRRALGLLDQVEPTDATTRARVDALRGHVAVRIGPVMDGYDLLTAAAETLADAEPETATALLAEATLAAFHAGDTAAMSAAAARAAQLSEAAGTSSAEIAGSVAQSLALVISGDGSQGAAYARRAIEVVEAGPELPDDPQALVWAALARLIVREADVGRDLVARVDRTARERAEIGLLPYLLTLVGRDQATTDQWAAAHASYDEAVRLARETGARAELGTLLAGWAWLAGRQGREDLCRSRAAEGAAICADVGSGLYQLWCIQALGYLELGLGQLPAAVREFEKQRTVMSERGITDVDLSPVPELVELYLRMERRSEAEALAEPYLAAAAAKAQPWSQARAHRCAGLLAGDDEADESFEQALEFHASTPDVFETARTELAYGARLRRARRRVDARAHLHTALAAFERLSAEPWVEQTSAELAATGETARVRDVTTLVQLTPQEFQIARLLADGATTRQAAAATFLSPKTIEYHLRSVYRKLGLHSRQELAEVMRSGR